MDNLCYFYLAFVTLSGTSVIDSLWSPAGKGLTSWLSFVVPDYEVVALP